MTSAQKPQGKPTDTAAGKHNAPSQQKAQPAHSPADTKTAHPKEHKPAAK